ncbi:MAG: DUF542 domain-containing protein [Acidimicrobiales bacterium]
MGLASDHPIEARSLAEIVDLGASAARVLERFGLDYCCGGSATLADACAEAGCDVAAVADALRDAPDEGVPGWASLAPAAMVDHLVATHHAYLHAELPDSKRSPRRSSPCTGAGTPSSCGSPSWSWPCATTSSPTSRRRSWCSSP